MNSPIPRTVAGVDVSMGNLRIAMPSAHRASRCRSSDWEPAAFETRA